MICNIIEFADDVIMVCGAENPWILEIRVNESLDHAKT